MIIKKIHFEIDKTNKAKLFKKRIFKKYVNYPARDSDVIVVIGGDGFMLQILKMQNFSTFVHTKTISIQL